MVGANLHGSRMEVAPEQRIERDYSPVDFDVPFPRYQENGIDSVRTDIDTYVGRF